MSKESEIGRRLREEPQNPHGLRCYNGNGSIKADGVQQPYTKEQLDEYIKCSQDIEYFIENYCKVMTLDYGFTNIKLRDYQRRFFRHIDRNRYSICKWGRQSGKSASSMLYILWKVLFTPDQAWFILANKLETAREIFSRVKDCYETLPFWLQQGVKKLNESTIDLSNGSSVTAAATSKSAIRGRTASGVLIDEASFVEHDEEFFTSVFPVISSGTSSKMILVSTPNGMNNTFYRIYQDALKNRGEFRHMEIEWNEVPGRDDEWRKKMIDTVGRRKFDQEYMCSFLGNEGSLIPLDILERISVRKPLKEVEGLYIYEDPKENHTYVMTVDVSRGSGLDYSAFSVIDITTLPYTQVACYYNNEIPTMVYPHIIYEVGNKYNYANVMVELNDAGIQVADILAQDLEYMSIVWVGQGKGGQKIGAPANQKPGVRTTKQVRTIGCSNLRLMMEQEKLEIWDKNTFSEMTAFVAKGDRYEADTGAHDDLMMTLVLFGWLIESDFFSDLMNRRTREDLVADRLGKLEEAMLPFGFFDDGKGAVYDNPNTVIDYSQRRIRDEYSDWMYS